MFVGVCILFMKQSSWELARLSLIRRKDENFSVDFVMLGNDHICLVAGKRKASWDSWIREHRILYCQKT